MWMASLGKREFLETIAGGPSAETIIAASEFSSKRTLHGLQGRIATFWRDQPEDHHSFPILAVVEKSQIRDLLAALNASPKALSPFTAFCRIMDYGQAEAYLNRMGSPRSDALVDAVGLLSLVEVQLLSEGQIKARQVSPAAARRTLSFVWGRGVASGLSLMELEELTSRWLEAYSLCNSLNASESNTPSVHYALPVLTTVCGLIENELPFRPIERLIAAIINSDGQAKDSAWREASDDFALNISLQSIESASREERGAYLQRMFRGEHRPGSSEQGAAQGFLATQVAPGSLEHLDIVLSQGGPEAAFWYVLFAALQKPHAILNAFGGLGRRIARDVRDCETLDQSPRADMGLDELRLLARANADGLVSKVGHSNEIEIELLPGISATFRFGRSAAVKAGSIEQRAFRMWNDQLASDLRRIYSLVEKTLTEVEDAAEPGIDPKTKRTRRARY
ncbi:hypothetical protein EOA32_01660 [Mesorhizobium sp. M1A.F.Ca.ET.072.01.1.1]|uniref:hypothetical protein n=1 Tax=Mesorhizobium sp. M1A.F.Ca.ET.072.01.1.1 TaxID=2496753 RepID=UPI000FD2F015|nr:hypothetical protein [Mesorhizobium sp. M1A.F.Ca.ET.072.01.1.1]RUW55480.1 hypothetical protein EOA32_01660 [Mesorhizobium sp. M1A.F.Ca.ET.072.01.1.1]TIV04608.1 MAG: hypothetical protein E5W04_02610 [Mesorhizobium sp.]